jgi:hypothetical protein
VALERVHVLVAEPKVMTDLVNEDVGNEVLEILALLAPFGEDRLSKQADSVGQSPGCFDAPLTDRYAFVDAREVERMVDAELRQQFRIGDFIDLQDDGRQMRRERLGQGL